MGQLWLDLVGTLKTSLKIGRGKATLDASGLTAARTLTLPDVSGVVALRGSGNTLLVISPLQNQPPASNYATLDIRNSHPVLDFDDTTDETAVFRLVLPRTYAGGGLTVLVHYAMTSATSGKVRWEVSIERIGNAQQDLDADGFASAQGVNVAAVPGTSGHVDIASIAFTNGAQMDSIAVGEAFRLKIQRKPSDTTNDTATGDAELVAVEVRET